MKQHARFFMQQASQMDTSARRIFSLTRLVGNLMLLASAALLLAAPHWGDRTAAITLAEGLFHAFFRVAAVGTAAGFAADIAAKRSRG